ncbi:MAG: helix-turn-helix transcriptional regulator, partial [Pseudomonadota bacterium]
SDLHFPCFMLNPFETEFSSCDGECFYQLIQAITQHFIVQVKQKEGIYLHLEPYRLALYERAWYLIGYASPY